MCEDEYLFFYQTPATQLQHTSSFPDLDSKECKTVISIPKEQLHHKPHLGETELPRKFTYAKAGVDREMRIESKKALQCLKETYKYSPYGEVIRLPYGNVFPMGKGRYLDLQIEGVGTKVLVAQLANKYDTIGIDGVAMVVNDIIRSGARPLAIADNIHAQVSDPDLVKEWMAGLVKGATEAGCIVPNGEIGDVPELIKGLVEGKGFD